jgi:hypothetical protein
MVVGFTTTYAISAYHHCQKMGNERRTTKSWNNKISQEDGSNGRWRGKLIHEFRGQNTKLEPVV